MCVFSSEAMLDYPGKCNWYGIYYWVYHIIYQKWWQNRDIPTLHIQYWYWLYITYPIHRRCGSRLRYPRLSFFYQHTTGGGPGCTKLKILDDQAFSQEKCVGVRLKYGRISLTHPCIFWWHSNAFFGLTRPGTARAQSVFFERPVAASRWLRNGWCWMLTSHNPTVWRPIETMGQESHRSTQGTWGRPGPCWTRCFPWILLIQFGRSQICVCYLWSFIWYRYVNIHIYVFMYIYFMWCYLCMICIHQNWSTLRFAKWTGRGLCERPNILWMGALKWLRWSLRWWHFETDCEITWNVG